MKKIFFIALLAATACSQSETKTVAQIEEKPLTREQVANHNIKQHLNLMLNDTSTYQSVSFDSLVNISRKDSLEFLLDSLKVRYEVVSKTTMALGRRGGSEFKEYANYSDKLADQIDSVLTELEKPETQSTVVGLRKIHTFRASNETGSLVMNKIEFVFDTTLNIVAANPLN